MHTHILKNLLMQNNMQLHTSGKTQVLQQLYLFVQNFTSKIKEKLGIQTRAARGFAIPSSCGGPGALGAWPPTAAITDQVARFARHFLSAEQPKMKALKYSSNWCDTDQKS